MTDHPSNPSSPFEASDAGSLQYGIGALSEATGVPAPTLRTWERRYGFPVATRTSGGQRVYGAEAVDHVRLASRAIGAGHRPAAVFKASISELRGLLGESGTAVAPAPSARHVWEGVENLDGPGMDALFRQIVAREGLWGFAIGHILPLLRQVGEATQAGRLTIYQEHAFSERLRDFLANAWRPIADGNRGPVGLCVTLPGERHSFGLHLVATGLALEGWRVAYFGVDLPPSEAAAGAATTAAAAVFVSISEAASRADGAVHLAALRAALPSTVSLVVGGSGAMDSPGVVRLDSLDGLRSWLSRQ